MRDLSQSILSILIFYSCLAAENSTHLLSLGFRGPRVQVQLDPSGRQAGKRRIFHPHGSWHHSPPCSWDLWLQLLAGGPMSLAARTPPTRPLASLTNSEAEGDEDKVATDILRGTVCHHTKLHTPPCIRGCWKHITAPARTQGVGSHRDVSPRQDRNAPEAPEEFVHQNVPLHI